MKNANIPILTGYERYPRAIELQTTSACNARCIICPHADVSRGLPSGTMDIDLFRLVVDQIEPSWRTRIIPYLNNEPTLDPFIISRLRYISYQCPDSDVELSTNVSGLTPAMQTELSRVRLKELRLSVFGFTEETHRLLMPGLHWREVKQNLDHLVGNAALCGRIERLSLVMIDHPLVTDEDIKLAKEYCGLHSISYNLWGFLDRSGNVARFSNGICNPAVRGCEQRRPLERMHITFTGDVILCCQDWRWTSVIGNVKNNPLLEIWNSDKYNRYRDGIYAGKGDPPELCKRCKLSLRASLERPPD